MHENEWIPRVKRYANGCHYVLAVWHARDCWIRLSSTWSLPPFIARRIYFSSLVNLTLRSSYRHLWGPLIVPHQPARTGFNHTCHILKMWWLTLCSVANSIAARAQATFSRSRTKFFQWPADVLVTNSTLFLMPSPTSDIWREVLLVTCKEY